MDEAKRSGEVSFVVSELQGQKRVIEEATKVLSDLLTVHAVRNKAFYAAAKEIVDKNPVPAAIAEKVYRGALPDEESFSAESNVWKSEEIAAYIARVLDDAQQNPGKESVFEQMKLLIEIAKQRYKETAHSIAGLNARIVFLGKWVADLTAEEHLASFGSDKPH